MQVARCWQIGGHGWFRTPGWMGARCARLCTGRGLKRTLVLQPRREQALHAVRTLAWMW